MARRLLLFTLLWSLTSSLIGCVVAVPEVSSLTELPSFSNKSTSPFQQDNIGGILYLSGECLPNVTGFEFRMDDNTIWSSISSTAPSPGANEFIVGTPTYDIDCTDGTFDFYIFISTALSNYTDNGISISPVEPEPDVIELKALGISGLPTITFKRPEPYTFEVTRNYFHQSHFLENSYYYKFQVRLIDSLGQNVRMSTGETKLVSISLTDLDASMLPAGILLNETCSTAVVPADLTFDAGEDEINLCYHANGTTDHHTIRAEISASGMISNFVNILIKPQHSVISSFTTTDFNSSLPPVLLKGVDYTFKATLNTLDSVIGRNVSNFNGQFTIGSPQINVTLSDPSCVVNASSDLECPMTSSYEKSFTIKVENSFPASYVTLQASAEPQTACGSGCSIFQSPTTYQISHYIPQYMTFQVVSGSSTYNQPYFRPRESIMKLNECRSLDLALANDDGTIIPAIAKTLTISTAGSEATFYTNPDCTTSAGTSNNYVFAANNYIKQVYYKVTSFPSGGIITWNIFDGVTTFQKPYYVSSH